MAFTKVVGPGIHTLSNILSHNINSSGIITATKFVGPFDNAIIGGGTTISTDGINVTGIVTATGLDINGNGDISGNLVLGGDLTVNGTTTTLDTNLIGVDRVEIGAAGAVVGLAITQSGSADLVRLYDGSTQVITVGSTGAVGIGTINPSQKLEIYDGRLLVNNLTDDAAKIVMRDNSGSYHHYQIRNQGGTFKIRNSGATPQFNVITALNTGNVGIGTDVPQFKLETNGEIASKNPANLEFIGLHLTNNEARIRSSFYSGKSGAYRPITFFTSDEERLRINTYGQVGVNTTVPAAQFGIAIDSNNTNPLATGGIALGLKNTNTTDNSWVCMDFNNSVGGIVGRIGAQFKDTSDKDTDLYFATRADGGSLSERLRIDSVGTVTFKGGEGSTDHIKVESEAGGTAIFLSNFRGVSDTGDSSSRLGVGKDNNALIFTNASGSQIAHFAIGNTDAIPLVLSTGNTQRIHITGAGTIQCKGETDIQNNILRVTDATPRIIMSVPSGGLDTRLFNDGSGNFIIGHGTNSDAPTERIKINSSGKAIFSEEIETPQDYPNFRPTLDLNFAASKKLDPKITYSRTGPASFVDEFGKVVLVGDNEPRFDHDPTTKECKGLLIEESRTNIFASSDPGHSAWLLDGGVTKGVNTTETTAPDGTFTACKLMSQATANSTSQIYDGMSRSSGGVQSLWAKKGTHNVIGIYDFSGNGGIRAWFDVNTGEHRCEGGSKVAAGVQSNGNDTNNTNMVEYPNGWYRCIYYEAANMTYAHFRIVDFDSDSEASASSNSIYLWGLQAEEGGVKFATSLIPCNTGFMPGTVSRGRDIVDIDGEDFTDFYNQTESTILSSHTLLTGVPNAENVYVYQIQDASTNNCIRVIDKNSSYSNVATALILNSGSSVAHFNNTTDSFTKDKVLVALSVKNNDFAASHNGGTVESDTSGTLATNFNSIGIGRYPPSGGYELNGHFQRFIYYPKQLSDSQLKTLTA